ncbi:uncharacterized protein [Ptychodera flava]|uniref:uncharacterized protein n=1 Tax=Ptychodera flava TaxID=63121 RepID=UPI00396A6DAF
MKDVDTSRRESDQRGSADEVEKSSRVRQLHFSDSGSAKVWKEKKEGDIAAELRGLKDEKMATCDQRKEMERPVAEAEPVGTNRRSTCNVCHRRGHKSTGNKNNEGCLVGEACRGYIFCGRQDKHKNDYFARLRKLKEQENKLTKAITEKENELQQIRDFESRSEGGFTLAIMPRLQTAFPEKYNLRSVQGKIALQRDISVLRKAYNNKVQQIPTEMSPRDDRREFSRVMEEQLKSTVKTSSFCETTESRAKIYDLLTKCSPVKTPTNIRPTRHSHDLSIEEATAPTMQKKYTMKTARHDYDSSDGDDSTEETVVHRGNYKIPKKEVDRRCRQRNAAGAPYTDFPATFPFYPYMFSPPQNYLPPQVRHGQYQQGHPFMQLQRGYINPYAPYPGLTVPNIPDELHPDSYLHGFRQSPIRHDDGAPGVSRTTFSDGSQAIKSSVSIGELYHAPAGRIGNAALYRSENMGTQNQPLIDNQAVAGQITQGNVAAMPSATHDNAVAMPSTVSCQGNAAASVSTHGNAAAMPTVSTHGNAAPVPNVSGHGTAAAMPNVSGQGNAAAMPNLSGQGNAAAMHVPEARHVALPPSDVESVNRCEIIDRGIESNMNALLEAANILSSQ